MSTIARRRQRDTNIWPGFVDALATLLMVIIFLLMVFVLAQFFLGQALSGRDEALLKLQDRVGELAELLSLERSNTDKLRKSFAQLSGELQISVALRDDMKTTIGKLRQQSAETEQKLTTALAAMEADKSKLSQQLKEISDLTRDVVALRALRSELQAQIAEMAGKLEQSGKKLLAEQEISESGRAKVALLNQQMAALRQTLAKISQALEVSEKRTKEQNVQIAALGKRLNAALANKVHELSRYRSEFFGRLRDVLGAQKGVRIVGDRFVFQSEVLFSKGAADIGEAGKNQLLQLARTLQEISRKIPADLDWVLRVDGHTDKDPIKTARFPSNWELSSARAISVVQFLINQGLAPNRLAATGFGEYQPLENRDDEIAKRRNRRIELKFTQR
ncbi:MAG: peptidoglycan -binding protein [Alphaproteobacteria bacterium]|jgi:chemotaxis protein MotB|nr:peptidoglycan -binding protein [Alphaproteobacteria bacterium]MBT7943831.1 peptidoglycan -binding protein [Alphaproteobacteria bacterium]